MRGRFLFLMIVSVIIWSCEDPTTLPISKVFSSNKLQTAYIDTFSVITSIVQLDSVLTSGTGSVLLGKYKDDELGTVAASSYFQVGYNGTFLPDTRFVFDSAVLVLPYNHTFSGDTSKAVNVNVYQLTQQMTIRTLPNVSDLKLSVYNLSNGFFNTSTVKRAATPIVSKSLLFYPHRDTAFIRLPDSFGANWFRLAQADSGQVFSNVSNFINNYFYGINLDVDPGTDACVVGFNASKLKIRFYYKKYVGDLLRETHYDFLVYNSSYQFNHIDYDRTGTNLASLPKLTPLSSTTGNNNVALIQSGTGVVTRLDFPSLKDFFSINNGVILNAAFLEVYPVRGSYPKNLLPLSNLSLYTTDMSNMPLSTISGGTASIYYDYEFGVNTAYRYQLFPYLFSQLKSSATYVTPLIIGPSTSQGSSVQRVYLGDRFHSETKIKLKIYYSYALN